MLFYCIVGGEVAKHTDRQWFILTTRSSSPLAGTHPLRWSAFETIAAPALLFRWPCTLTSLKESTQKRNFLNWINHSKQTDIRSVHCCEVGRLTPVQTKADRSQLTELKVHAVWLFKIRQNDPFEWVAGGWFMRSCGFRWTHYKLLYFPQTCSYYLISYYYAY